MSSTVQLPEREPDLQDVAEECARRVLQLEAGPIRKIAREAARKSPIKLDADVVGGPTLDAVDALKLEGRVLDALRSELGEEGFRRASGKLMMKIESALTRASNEIADEAIEERVRELSEREGIPLPGDQFSCVC